jgi:hypothetical protein
MKFKQSSITDVMSLDDNENEIISENKKIHEHKLFFNIRKKKQKKFIT